MSTIMFCGDSTTLGQAGGPETVTPMAGYRGHYLTAMWGLYRTGGAADPAPVGNLSDPAYPHWGYHEGHGGWKIADMQSAMSGILTYHPNPGAMLLWIGLNDGIAAGWDVSTAPTAAAGLRALVRSIRTLSPGTAILVGTLPAPDPAVWGPLAPQWTAAVNAGLPWTEANALAAGARVRLVDVGGVLTVADYADGLHPTDAGYAKVAAKFFTG